MTEIVEFVHGHLFCGIGGGAEGFNDGEARLGSREVKYRCAGGVDVDVGAIKAFTQRAGVAGTVLTTAEVKEWLLDELAKGRRVIPLGKPCEGFSYETGCPGHEGSA